jgi:hypothetical protein
MIKSANNVSITYTLNTTTLQQGGVGVSTLITNALSSYATTTNLNTKQNTLIASTTILGIGSNITSLNYNNIFNPPNLSQYALSTDLTNKQNTLAASTTLLGIGSSITQLNYANISNPPTLIFLSLNGGTLVGSVITNATNSAFNFGGGSGAAVGQASDAGAFSSSAGIGDCIVRSQATKQLILQSGSGAGAIIINSGNDTTITGALNVGGILTVLKDTWMLSSDGI